MARFSRPAVGLLIVGLGSLAAPLDTAVNIAFPSITRAFDLQVADIRWVVIAYVLTYASLMLAFGRLGDLLGYRRIFQIGLLVSALGFGACSVASTYPLLLLGRMLQGVGIALTLSCAPALAISLYDERDRTRVLGIYTAIAAAGSALGPLAGGFLVEHAGWPAVFWPRAPLVLVALALSWLIPPTPRQGSMRGFDALGAALLVTWMSALLLVFAVPSEPFGRTLPLGLALLAALALAAFLRREARHPQPLIRLSLFRDAGFAIMNAASIAVNLAAFSVLLLVPYYLVRIAHMDTTAGGILLACGAGGTVVGSWMAGRLAALVAVRRLALAGVALSIAGLWTISTWTPATPLGVLGLSLLLQGLGVGLFQVAYADLVTATLPAQDRGVAGSLTILTRTIGIVGGATALSAAFRAFEATALSAGMTAADAFLAGFQATFFYAAAGLALCLAIGLLRPRIWLGRT
jgi:MFS family permease